MSNESHRRPTHKSYASNPFETQVSHVELCEKRLVLSAQFVCEALAVHALAATDSASPEVSFHLEEAIRSSEAADLTPVVSPTVLPQSDIGPAIESHLREAHQATGWGAAREQFGLSGSGQTVAVIDSGVAWDHVSLGGGYGPGYRVVGGWDFAENDSQPYDDGPAGFHGTHVAGIIASDDVQHSGVAPDADIVALRVFNDAGQGQLAWVEQALTWVYENRNTFENPITTVNLSLGATWNSDSVPSWGSLENELQQLSDAGIVVVASAGNSFQQYDVPGLSYPAASPYVLPVASVGDDGLLSDFSQRNQRVIAAPGESILSTVPDYYLGRDGRLNDFATASGTSMAAPYVAGAAVLVREAMEMVGLESIGLSTITQHLRSTADSVYDALTGATYSRLNLANAIDSLIPDDAVGDTIATSSLVSVDGELTGWINSTNDRDSYRFTADSNGTLQLQASSQWASNLQWQLTGAEGQIATGTSDLQSIHLSAGQTYHLNVSSPGAIGGFTINMDFAPSASNGSGEGASGSVQTLGSVDYLSQSVDAGSHYRVQAERDGVFTVQWHNPDSPAGELSVQSAQGTLQDNTWVNGTLRIDVNVRAGDWLDVALPGSGHDMGRLDLANVIQVSGSTLTLNATEASDALRLDLTSGVQLAIGHVEYTYDLQAARQLVIDAGANNDSLVIVGSSLSDKVDLMPGQSTLVNSAINATIRGVEEISFEGGGGADRVYLYDSNTADTLTARPREATLQGVGYRFEVSNVDRLFMHATGDGEDIAYLYDSPGNDTLSVRPQFTSMSGDGFFNYVRGFERVYAYANAGGYDTADIYDSAGNDRFITNGVAASIFGPGFASYTRGFDNVVGHATAGGQDTASLYAADNRAEWWTGIDQVRVADSQWTREARSFESYETFVAGRPYVVTAPAAAFAPPADYAGALQAEGERVELESLVATAGNSIWPATQQTPQLDMPAVRPQTNAEGWSDWLAAEPEAADTLEMLPDPALELQLLDDLFRQLDSEGL